jgi:hypothetical protein
VPSAHDHASDKASELYYSVEGILTLASRLLDMPRMLLLMMMIIIIISEFFLSRDSHCQHASRSVAHTRKLASSSNKVSASLSLQTAPFQ